MLVLAVLLLLKVSWTHVRTRAADNAFRYFQDGCTGLLTRQELARKRQLTQRRPSSLRRNRMPRRRGSYVQRPKVFSGD